MRKKRAHEQEGLPVGRRVVAFICGGGMKPATVTILTLFVGSMASLATPWHPLVKIALVWGSLLAIVVLVLMMHFREAESKIPHMRDE